MRIRVKAEGVLIDRDGVLNHAKDGGVIDGAIPWLEDLGKRGIPFLIATNHTTSSPEEAGQELRRAGFDIDSDRVHTPLSILEGLLTQGRFRRVYVRGTPELHRFIRLTGVEVVRDERVDAVILGFDRRMDYEAVSTSISAILDHDAALIALHENRIFRDSEQRVEPGLGAWVRAIEYATGCRACIVGKPSRDYYLAALKKLDIAATGCIMISDDPFGDLHGAAALGIRTIFARSGKYRDPSVLGHPDIQHQPDYMVNSIMDIEIT